jgi:ribonuclease E
MLDTEPNNDNTNEAAEQPAKKAARKAPAKRAPRKAPAKKAAAQPALDTALTPQQGDPSASSEPQTSSRQQDGDAQPAAASANAGTISDAPAAAAAPAKKAPRKRAAKKVAPPAASEPVAELEQAGAAESQAVPSDAAPEKRTPRKRTSKRAAAEAGPTTATADTEASATAPALAAPSVLFQAPSESKPAPRKRSARAKRTETDLAEPAAPLLPEAELEDLQSPTDADDETPDGVQPDTDSDDTDAETDQADGPRRRRRRGRRGRGSKSGNEGGGDFGAEELEAEADTADDEDDAEHADEVAEAALSASARRRRRRRRSSGSDAVDGEATGEDDPPNTVVHVRDSRGGSNRGGNADDDGVRGVKGSTRLEAKRQRRRDNRDSGRRRAPILTEAEFLARREAVERVMAVRQTGDRTQIAVLEDDILVEHYVTRASAASAVGNVYLGRVQNVLPSMEAAFVDIGRGRNGVLYAGEVNWDSAGLEGKARSIESALSPGDTVLVQVTKDPIGHKGARLTSQVSLPGRFVVYVPGGGMTGISRKLPDTERSRLKSILKKVVPDEAGVIVRTAAEGASEQDLISDVERLKSEWDAISSKAQKKTDGPMLLHGEPDLAIRVVRDIFNDDFSKLVVAGSEIHRTLSDYVADIAPELASRISLHTGESDLFRDLRVDEQLAKALDRKVWLPSGGSLVIDRTEAMTVVDVNTGKYTGSGGNLEQTVTRNNLEAAEEIVRQLRLRDLGGIVVIDFIDMVLESNRDLVLRRLTECLGRDRTKHQVAEVTSLGLVQMTRKRVGEGLLEAFSEPCEHCHGRGVIVHMEPVDKRSGSGSQNASTEEERPARSKRSRGSKSTAAKVAPAEPDEADLAAENEKRRAAASAIAAIAAATTHHDPAGADTASEAANTDTATGAVASSDTTAAGQASSNGFTAAAAAPVSGELVYPEATPSGADSATDGQASPTVLSSAATGTRALGGAGTANGDAAPTRPRRRRAASRPAGPPAPVSTVPEG